MPPLSEDDRADLVAYLDGELDEASAHALEARLSLDPEARTEAEALKRTWELLDYLPRVEPSPSFTHRTLERVAVRETQRLRSITRRWPVWVSGVGWAAGIMLVIGAGLALGQLLWTPQTSPPLPGPNQGEEQLVRDLRLLQNKHLYDPIANLEELEALNHPDLFGDEELD